SATTSPLAAATCSPGSGPALADPMRIVIAVPIRPGTTSGNDVTTARWARRLAELGHETSVVATGNGAAAHGGRADEAARAGSPSTSRDDPAMREADVLVALHARRCAPVVAWWRATFPDRPIVVGLAGTDLYHDLP